VKLHKALEDVEDLDPEVGVCINRSYQKAGKKLILLYCLKYTMFYIIITRFVHFVLSDSIRSYSYLFVIFKKKRKKESEIPCFKSF
jgi:hypothetical protein